MEVNVNNCPFISGPLSVNPKCHHMDGNDWCNDRDCPLPIIHPDEEGPTETTIRKEGEV